jgi:hypothetical protein
MISHIPARPCLAERHALPSADSPAEACYSVARRPALSPATLLGPRMRRFPVNVHPGEVTAFAIWHGVLGYPFFSLQKGASP